MMNNSKQIDEYSSNFEYESKFGNNSIGKSNKVNGDFNHNSPLMRKQVFPDSQYFLNEKISLFTSEISKEALPVDRILNDLISRKKLREHREHKDQSDITNGCTCYKTKCVKKYCVCYGNGISCGIHCKCLGCANNKLQIQCEDKEINVIKGDYCTCTKSKCVKQYCECFKQNKECGINCRCINCLNKKSKKQKGNIKHISIQIQSKVIDVTETDEQLDNINHTSNDEEGSLVEYKSLLFFKAPIVNTNKQMLNDVKAKMFKVLKKKH